ncbi:MAG: methionine--tRNA ligase [Patescibacteria group bacterium]
MPKFYITAAIPYVNAPPHIGHALEFVQADVVARYHKLIDDDVCQLCGGDENALKNVQAAEKAGKNIQEFVDENTKLFEELAKQLNVRFDIFQKGSSQQHHESSQELWNRCFKSGDIYKKEYSGLYCVGCELFYSPGELDEKGECLEHPGKKLETVTEENYFFKLSKYQKNIIDLIQTNRLSIVPEKRKNEVLGFLKNPLQDISISRTNERAKNWGVSVPNDATQRMYVWFDALNIYQSGIGFGSNEENYKKWWPADVHVIGKGIIRFHAVYWPAFLLSAKLKPPKQLFVHEYFTVNGQKMSKTLGNVIDPIGLVKKYGADGVRLYFLKHFSAFNDGDFSEDKFKEAYNADLANGLGNLVARVARLCEKVELDQLNKPELNANYKNIFKEYRFNDLLNEIWENISKIDQEIEIAQPWKITDNEELKNLLQIWVNQINQIAYELKPFLPVTSKKIQNLFGQSKIKSTLPLFPRV